MPNANAFRIPVRVLYDDEYPTNKTNISSSVSEANRLSTVTHHLQVASHLPWLVQSLLRLDLSKTLFAIRTMFMMITNHWILTATLLMKNGRTSSKRLRRHWNQPSSSKCRYLYVSISIKWHCLLSPHWTSMTVSPSTAYFSNLHITLHYNPHIDFKCSRGFKALDHTVRCHDRYKYSLHLWTIPDRERFEGTSSETAAKSACRGYWNAFKVVIQNETTRSWPERLHVPRNLHHAANCGKWGLGWSPWRRRHFEFRRDGAFGVTCLIRLQECWTPLVPMSGGAREE